MLCYTHYILIYTFMRSDFKVVVAHPHASLVAQAYDSLFVLGGGLLDLLEV